MGTPPLAKCKIIATIIQGAPQASFDASVFEQNIAGAYNTNLTATLAADVAAGNDAASTAVWNNGVDHYLMDAMVDAMVDAALQQVVTDMLPKKVLPGSS